MALARHRQRLAAACALCALAAAAVGAAAAPRAHAAPPSEAVYRKLCRAVRAQHVRDLFTVPLAPIRLGGSSDCAFAPRGGNASSDGVRMFLRIDDGDQTLWKHLGDRPYGTFRPLKGAGALAKWGYLGRRLPSVVDARSGTFTCTLIPSGTGTKFAQSSGSPLTAARAFAVKLLRLCADVFAAHR